MTSPLGSGMECFISVTECLSLRCFKHSGPYVSASLCCAQITVRLPSKYTAVLTELSYPVRLRSNYTAELACPITTVLNELSYPY